MTDTSTRKAQGAQSTHPGPGITDYKALGDRFDRWQKELERRKAASPEPKPGNDH